MSGRRSAVGFLHVGSLACRTSVYVQNENLQENRLMVETFSVPGNTQGQEDRVCDRETKILVVVRTEVHSILTCRMYLLCPF